MANCIELCGLGRDFVKICPSPLYFPKNTPLQIMPSNGGREPSIHINNSIYLVYLWVIVFNCGGWGTFLWKFPPPPIYPENYAPANCAHEIVDVNRAFI